MLVQERQESGSACRDDDESEPVAKRTRFAAKKLFERPKVEAIDSSIDEPTVLDVLNEDCWRIILDQVKLQDLARSELVSRRWRSVVLRYLRGIRVKLYSRVEEVYKYQINLKNTGNHRMLYVPEDRFKAAVKKFGPTILLGECRSAVTLRAFSKFCPNIEDIGFSDRHIAKFLGYTTLEELELIGIDRMTGTCFSGLRTNLRTLSITSCKALNLNHLASVPERLSELTKLELNYCKMSHLENLNIFLEKTPNLEYLGLENYNGTAKVGALVKAICRLSKLRHLNLFGNGSVTDKWLEDVGRCCGLRTVNVADCEDVTAEGVVSLCRGAGQTLVSLDASYIDDITEGYVARCVSYCPKLEIFQLQSSHLVGRHLPLVVAAVHRGGRRARPLHLNLSSLANQTMDDSPPETCADLIVNFNHGNGTLKCGD